MKMAVVLDVCRVLNPRPSETVPTGDTGNEEAAPKGKAYESILTQEVALYSIETQSRRREEACVANFAFHAFHLCSMHPAFEMTYDKTLPANTCMHAIIAWRVFIC